MNDVAFRIGQVLGVVLIAGVVTWLSGLGRKTSTAQRWCVFVVAASLVMASAFWMAKRDDDRIRSETESQRQESRREQSSNEFHSQVMREMMSDFDRYRTNK